MFRIRPPLRAFHIPVRRTPQPTFRPSQTQFQPLRSHAQRRYYEQQSFNRNPRYQRFMPAGRLYGLLVRWYGRPTFYRDIGIITAGAGGIYIYNLEEVPVSGRRRFNIISPGMEEMMGKATVDQVREEYQGKILPDYDPRVRSVKKVLQRLLPFAEGEGLKELEWEVAVIDSPEQNAFVAPGGKVFVFTGILPLCEDENGIAAVLGHEIAHVVAHHTAERMSQAPLILLGCIALSMFDVSFYSGKMLLDLFLSMPASRKHEAEADFIGLMMMAQGCYRPEAAMDFWARMEKAGKQAPPEILSTHPSNHNREEKIREWLPKAQEKAEESDCSLTGKFANEFTSALGGFGRW